MDKATPFGLIIGALLIVGSILVGGDLMLFVNIPSVLVTVGGTIAATLIAFPIANLKDTLKITVKAFIEPKQDPSEVIKLVVDFATTARRDGILALEEKAAEIDNTFLKKGIALAVDGSTPETLKDVLETEITYLEGRHKMGADIFATSGGFAPAFGLIGTLIGLVQMLAKMDDPSKIGAGMAVALLTTLYGAIMANLVLLPLEKKLKVKSQSEMLSLELVIEGVMSIQAGDNPRVVQDKLKAFIAPGMRSQFEDEE